MVNDSSNSMLSVIAGGISPIFAPLGFNDYRITTSLISGILAKEGVVSSLSILFGSETNIYNCLNSYQAFCLLIFCLLYTPCVAALASIRQEEGHKWAIVIGLFQFVIAWLASGLFSLIFHIFGVM